MPKADRAKQFMPFAALKGYYDLVAAQERVIEPKRELDDERVARLSSVLETLKTYDIVEVVYYDECAYTTIEGSVTHLDVAEQDLTIITTHIAFADLWDIQQR